MYSFLKAFLVLMKLLSLSQFYAPKNIFYFNILDYPEHFAVHPATKSTFTRCANTLSRFGNRTDLQISCNNKRLPCQFETARSLRDPIRFKVGPAKQTPTTLRRFCSCHRE